MMHAVFMIMLCISAVSAHGQNRLLFDGELPFNASNGVVNTTTPFRGTAAFEGIPTIFQAPSIQLVGLPSYRADISEHDEIWFYAKSDLPGRTFTVQVYGYPQVSTLLPITPYIDGGVLDTEYRLIRMPTSLLKTGLFQLTTIDTFHFGIALPLPGHHIFVDEIWAVDFDVIDPAVAPWIGPTPPLDCGTVAVSDNASNFIALENQGNGPLEVSALYFEGEYAASFTTPQPPFTLAAGQTQMIEVNFAPIGHGANAARLVLEHGPTPMGDQTTLHLAGMGEAPEIGVSKNTLNFGEVPTGQQLTWNLTLKNTGNQPLNIGTLASSGTAFTVSPPAPFSIPPGNESTVQLAFQPGLPGTDIETLTIASDDPLLPLVEVPLKGIGKAPDTGPHTLPVDAEDVSSSTAALSWGHPESATAIRVFFGPEMGPSLTAPFPNQRLAANLSPGADTFTATKLAAATDVFFRIEIDTPDGMFVGTTHARTVGGPRVPLDTPLREVHAMAPDILMLVLENKDVHSFSDTTDAQDGGIDMVVGDTGSTWQGGPWSLQRADGSPIDVVEIFRQSNPVGQPYYTIGYNATDQQARVDVDHNIYLRLAEPIGANETLRVLGPLGLDVYIPFSDQYLETPAIQVNQVGYSPRATERWAYVSGWMGDGGALTDPDIPGTANVLFEALDPLVPRQTILQNLDVAYRSFSDADAGGAVMQIDLSALPAADGAVYRVQIPGVGVSWPTQVSESAVFKSYFTVMRGLTHNRWGRDLTSDWTEWSTRIPDHTNIFTGELEALRTFYPETQPLTGERPFQGGHHDAGDFDIQMVHYVLPMLLLRAFEVNYAAFTDGQLIIPESGNGIPDLLDEALWNIQGWQQLQEPDGGVRVGVESYRHPTGIYYADQDQLPYWSYARGTFHTMRCAGLFAQAARLVAPFDPPRAAELQDNAIAAYNYALANGLTAANRGAVFYGAGELFRLTGDPQYASMYEAAWAEMNNFGTGAFSANYPFLPWASSFLDTNQPVLNDYLLGYFSGLGARDDFRAIATQDLIADASTAVAAVRDNYAHRNGRKLGFVPTWGQGTAVGEYVMRVVAKLSLDGLAPDQAQTYFNAISLSADYVLGCNPNGMVWLTGLGSRFPREPLHLDALAFLSEDKGLIPGIPVFGPILELPGSNYYDYGENVLYPPFNDRPGFHRYVDLRTFVMTNEFDLTVQARQAQLFALMVAPGLMPGAEWHPGGTEHRNTLAPRTALVPDTSQIPEKIELPSLQVPWFKPAGRTQR